MTNTVKTFDDLLGKTIWNISINHDAAGDPREVRFCFDDLTTLCLFDAEYGTGNDCEVRLIDVEGKLSDLFGRPLTRAESVSQSGSSDPLWNTWTFYRFATDKAFVTMRWGGRSNGYYSEEVSTFVDNDPSLAQHPDFLEFLAKRQKEFLKNEIGNSVRPKAPKKKI